MLDTLRDYLHRIYKRKECGDHQLLYLFLEITKLCNLSCRHCGSDCGSRRAFNSLSTSSWLKILDDISETFDPKPAIVLTGGEPILHPDFASIAGALGTLRFRWGLVSNGYDLDETMLGVLRSNGIHSITISLDGTERTHNWLRGKPDSYRKAVHAIGIVSKSDIPMNDVVTCVHPRNLGELDDISRVLTGAGARSWRLFRIFPAGRAQGNGELLLSHAETRTMLDWIADKKAKSGKTGLDVNLGCEGWLPFSTDRRLRDRPFFCRAGINIASILCDGTITGCSNNSELFFEGNVLEDSLAYKWENGFQIFRKRKWLENSDCRRCKYVKKCRGGSIHLWREHLKRPEFCYMDCYQPKGKIGKI